MQITDLYQTKITCSTYNANIDSTDTVITVSLIDFNGNAVTGKSVTLTCDKGYFNKKGSTAISGTTTKSITLNTDSNGQITGTWTASEWGLCTFSTNNISNQVNVKGWKSIASLTGLTAWANETTVKIRFTTDEYGKINFGTSTTTISSNFIPSGYRPNLPVTAYSPNHRGIYIINDSQGNFQCKSVSGSAINNVSDWIIISYSR